MRERKNMISKLSDFPEISYWVNKNSGTIHHIMIHNDDIVRNKIHTSTCNLRYERDYFYSNVDLNKFNKSYEFICDGAEVSNDYAASVLFNTQLKFDLKWGKISKEEFFNKIKESN